MSASNCASAATTPPFRVGLCNGPDRKPLATMLDWLRTDPLHLGLDWTLFPELAVRQQLHPTIVTLGHSPLWFGTASCKVQRLRFIDACMRQRSRANRINHFIKMMNFNIRVLDVGGAGLQMREVTIVIEVKRHNWSTAG